jgi:hypothetical protein
MSFIDNEPKVPFKFPDLSTPAIPDSMPPSGPTIERPDWPPPQEQPDYEPPEAPEPVEPPEIEEGE